MPAVAAAHVRQLTRQLGVAVRDPWLVMLGPDPLLRELRSERRLHDLLEPVFA